jgi:hypothetical protein
MLLVLVLVLVLMLLLMLLLAEALLRSPLLLVLMLLLLTTEVVLVAPLTSPALAVAVTGTALLPRLIAVAIWRVATLANGLLGLVDRTRGEPIQHRASEFERGCLLLGQAPPSAIILALPGLLGLNGPVIARCSGGWPILYGRGYRRYEHLLHRDPRRCGRRGGDRYGHW